MGEARFPKRVMLLAAIVAVPAVVAACGDDEESLGTLPPIQTTTSTSIWLTTTTFVEKFYVIQEGDTLGKIAEAFEVRLDDLMALNGIENADRIEAGQELKIPQGAVVISSLPTTSTSTTAAP